MSYKILTRSGTKANFLEMSKRCNAAGVRVYVDVVLNHMAGTDEYRPTIIGTANSTAEPEIHKYPGVPFVRQHFNRPCEIKDWADANILRNCELSGLRRDLNHTREFVRRKILYYLNRVIDMGAAGFSIDSAKHIWPHDLDEMMGELKNLNTEFGFEENVRPFVLIDLVDFGSAKGDVGRWEYVHIGRITEFAHPGEVGRAFRGFNDLKWLRNWGPQWNFLPPQFAIVFLVDHQIQRGLGQGYQNIITETEPKLFVMGNAFMLAHPYGTPRILSSYRYMDRDDGPPHDEFDNIVSPQIDKNDKCTGPWICEHRWLAIANMVKFRYDVDGSSLNNWWDNGKDQIAFSRGERGFVVWNGQNRHLKVKLQTCLPAGKYCDIISGNVVDGKCTGTVVKVEENGQADIFIEKKDLNGVIAIHQGSSLK